MVYHKNTEKLIPYYESRGLLRAVAGDGEIEAVYANIMQVLNQQAGPSC
jgi:adenylate kinase family enzyme